MTCNIFTDATTNDPDCSHDQPEPVPLPASPERTLLPALTATQPNNAPAVKNTFNSLVRHQLSSFASGGVDFGTMIALVRLCSFGPTLATAFAAAAGGVANFTLERRMVFADASGSTSGQAFRYTIVSASSLGLNALGEYVLTAGLQMQYVVARALVALSVSILWNFPLHRNFVFRRHVGGQVHRVES